MTAPAIPQLTLRRLQHTDFATYGQLEDAEQKTICVTIEKPWVDANGDGVSDRNVSCIPAGTYTAFRRRASTTRHGYDVFELENVPGRSNIQIHIANLPNELQGCIATGSNFGKLAGKLGVLGSASAYRRFMDRLRGIDRITLTIIAPE
jgi:hypothetical protein